MSVGASVPILYAQQMGPAGRLVHDLATHPEAAQSVSRHLSEAAFRQEAQQVQKLDDPAASTAIEDEEKRQADAEAQQQRRRAPKEPETEPESAPSSGALHLGLLVNYKI